jgi:DNA topoisomerase-1
LYEQGIITYMRTDGVYVAPEAVEATRKLIAKDYGNEFVPAKPRAYAAKAKNSQEAHEAIRPTDLFKTPAIAGKILEPDLANLYGLIWKRMVASQMENAVFDQVAIDFESADKFAILRANGSVVKFEGYRKVYEESSDDDKEEAEKTLPKVNKGEVFDVKKLSPEQHHTEPPPRYSEASLVKRMEELGIGRPSTYASIISVLQDRQYVTLDKKRFVPESRGRIVTAFLSSFFQKYVEYDYTANLEDQLDEVSEGKKEWKQVLREFWNDFSGKTSEAMELKITDVLERLNDDLETYIFPQGRKCPSCGVGTLGLRLGKFGGFIGCSNHPDCKHTKQLSYAEDGAEGEEGGGEERVLGVHPDGQDIYVKKGPYGWYLQLGEAIEKGDKPKRYSLAKGTKLDEITLEQAVRWLALPREVGPHPETGKMIKAGVGRFGPYLNYDGGFVSLKSDDVLEIGMNRAVELLALAAEKAKAGKLREVGEYKKKMVEIHKGRFGPFIKYGKSNIALPKGTDYDALTVEDAGKLIESKKKK